MKHLFYILAIFLLSLLSVKAQKPITLTDDSVRFGNRYFPGFWLNIPEVKTEVVKANWIKAIEKGTKSKVSVEKNEMTLFGAIIPDFYAGSMNIMSKTVDNDSLSRLFVSVETTRDNFTGRTSVEFDKLNKYLKKFGKDQYLNLAKDQLSAEEAKLSGLEKDLKSVRKSKERFEKEIQSSKVLISEKTDNIKGMKKELEVTDGDIDNLTSLLSNAPDAETKKVKQGELKDLQKKKKGLLKDINSADNSISKANTSIDDNTKNIELNVAKQKELSENILKQKLAIDKFQQKLKAIEAY